MINIGRYRDRFKERCLATGLIKLNEPIDTKEFVYCAFELKASDAEEDFDTAFFEPTMESLMRAIIEQEKGEFYRLDVTQKKNVFIFMSSRGNNTVASAWPDMFKWESGR